MPPAAGSVAAACRRAGLEELASSYDWKDAMSPACLCASFEDPSGIT